MRKKKKKKEAWREGHSLLSVPKYGNILMSLCLHKAGSGHVLNMNLFSVDELVKSGISIFQ